jgi:hypothetical protein
VDGAATVRGFARAGRPLDELIQCVCPGCRQSPFVSARDLVAMEREVGEPEAVVCKACYLRGPAGWTGVGL